MRLPWGQSGLGLDAQRAAVAAFVAGRGELLSEYTEVESGRRNDRPELDRALALCRHKRAVLVIAKLDRLARSVAFISNLMESGVEFVACDMPQANRLTLHILAAAKARGTRLGNPRPDLETARAARSAKAARFRDGAAPLARELRAQGRKLREIAAELNTRHIPTECGRHWHASSVGRLLDTA